VEKAFLMMSAQIKARYKAQPVATGRQDVNLQGQSVQQKSGGGGCC
jgi:hypothetical protein